MLLRINNTTCTHLICTVKQNVCIHETLMLQSYFTLLNDTSLQQQSDIKIIKMCWDKHLVAKPQFGEL